MRNYLAELKGRGYSFARLASETGVSSRQLSAFKSGKTKLTSSLPAYEKIRNANRRLAYGEARSAGLSPERANISRRTMFDPRLKAIIRKSTRVVKAKAPTTRYQLRILGEFHNTKTKATRLQNGFSHAYIRIDNAVMEEEAVNDARFKLGGTNWELRRIIEREMTEFVLTSEEAAEAVLDEEPEDDFDED